MSKTISTGRLTVSTRDVGGSHVVELDGQIDERCELIPIAKQISGAATIDLRGVSFINSIGVREWIKMLHQLTDQGVKVRLRNCSEALVHQFNMIIEAQAGAEVESFYAPYECDSCGNEASMVIEVAASRDALIAGTPPDLPCPECGKPMAFSELADRYLLFLLHGKEQQRASGGRGA